MTASVAIYRSDCVVVAADSAYIDSLGVGSKPICKIIPVGSFFYIPNGFSDDDSGYNVFKTMESLKDVSSLGVVATKAKEVLECVFLAALTRRRQKDTVRFMKQIRGECVLGLVLVGIENSRPSLIHLHFGIRDYKAEIMQLQTETHTCPGEGCPDGAGVFVGPDELKLSFQENNPNYYKGSPDDVLSSAKKFVQMAIDLGTPTIGPPISTLLLTATRNEQQFNQLPFGE